MAFQTHFCGIGDRDGCNGFPGPIHGSQVGQMAFYAHLAPVTVSKMRRSELRKYGFPISFLERGARDLGVINPVSS